jgi:hypothetical protein
MCNSCTQSRARSAQALRPANLSWEAAAYLALEAMQDQRRCLTCQFAPLSAAEPFLFRSDRQRVRACS